jgi:hypothetical protein
MRDAYKILVDSPEGRRRWKELGVDSRMIRNFILGEQGWKVWIVFMWLGIGTDVGFV